MNDVERDDSWTMGHVKLNMFFFIVSQIKLIQQGMTNASPVDTVVSPILLLLLWFSKSTVSFSHNDFY